MLRKLQKEAQLRRSGVHLRGVLLLLSLERLLHLEHLAPLHQQANVRRRVQQLFLFVCCCGGCRLDCCVIAHDGRRMCLVHALFSVCTD